MSIFWVPSTQAGDRAQSLASFCDHHQTKSDKIAVCAGDGSPKLSQQRLIQINKQSRSSPNMPVVRLLVSLTWSACCQPTCRETLHTCRGSLRCSVGTCTYMGLAQVLIRYRPWYFGTIIFRLGTGGGVVFIYKGWLSNLTSVFTSPVWRLACMGYSILYLMLKNSKCLKLQPVWGEWWRHTRLIRLVGLVGLVRNVLGFVYCCIAVVHGLTWCACLVRQMNTYTGNKRFAISAVSC